MTTTFHLYPGTRPLLISMPHVGTVIPPDQQSGLVPRALDCEDTDWHLERLYRPLAEAAGASLLVPVHSRYLIDLNRPPDDTPMYPGAANTELCPTRFFTGEPLYLPGRAPDADARTRRRRLYWDPYHQALEQELERLRGEHGRAVLFDAHSIRSELPWLFDGRLPDLNLGTADAASCDSALRERLRQFLAGQSLRSWVVDGRFKGGYITRHYGQPARGWHAVQLEMCQRNYMAESAPFDYDEQAAAAVQPLLAGMIGCLLDWADQA